MTTDRIEKAPVAEQSNTEGLGGLADAQLSDVHDVKSTASDTTTSAFGDSSDFEFQNDQGNMYKVDDKGNVTSFTYTDGGGDVVSSFTDIKRDEATGDVTGFTDSDGNVWEKLPGDPTSVFQAEREGGGWMYENKATGEVPRSPVELGKVTIDENGVTADGQNADYVTIPEDY